MKTTWKNFEITATYLPGKKTAKWDGRNSNYHLITVLNTENKERVSFDFWASLNEKELKTDYDLQNAFYCFLSDSLIAENGIDEYYSEFGVEATEGAFRDCEKSNAKLDRLLHGTTVDKYDLINELGEVAA